MAPENCHEKLLKLFRNVYNLEFNETPNYRKLKKLLEKCQ